MDNMIIIMIIAYIAGATLIHGYVLLPFQQHLPAPSNTALLFEDVNYTQAQQNVTSADTLDDSSLENKQTLTGLLAGAKTTLVGNPKYPPIFNYFIVFINILITGVVTLMVLRYIRGQ